MYKRIKRYNDGGMIEGPSHEEGGVMLTQGGQPSAEVEGGERIFSIQDTTQIEKMVAMMKDGSSDPDKIAKQLGYSVAKMVETQNKKQSSEPTPQQLFNRF